MQWISLILPLKTILRVKKKIVLKFPLQVVCITWPPVVILKQKSAAEVVLVVYIIVHKIPVSYNSKTRQIGK